MVAQHNQSDLETLVDNFLNWQLLLLDSSHHLCLTGILRPVYAAELLGAKDDHLQNHLPSP